MKTLLENWRAYTNSILLEATNKKQSILSIEHLNSLAKIAQEVYDKWDQNEEGYDDEVGYGGICHIIADNIVSYLDRAGLGSKHNFCSVSDTYVQHVYVLAYIEIENDEDEEETLYNIYSIDIPYWVYEEGGGFTWKKLKDVQFTGDDVVVELIQSYVRESDLNNYLGYD
jgi:hypothetical protein